MNLKKNIENYFAQAFVTAFPTIDLAANPIEITQSTQPQFGHYQCNSAMKLTKVLGQPPRAIAQKIVDILLNQTLPHIEKLEIAGPGFINITLANNYITQICQELLTQQSFKVAQPQRIVIDYSSPNIAKEMHVGHLRTTIIGDSLARLFDFLGHDVLRLNHVGDWGTSFGMLIAYIKQYTPEILTNPQTDLQTLKKCYQDAKKLFDEDPAFKKQAQFEVVRLQSHEPDSIKVWEMICDISRVAFQEIYDLLDIKLVERGESFYNPYLKEMVDELERKNLITLSGGAKCVFLEGFTNREGEPLPFIVQKTDGGFNYSTTDLAALKHRVEFEKAQRIIYVIDAGQSTHMAMLFATAIKAGFVDPHKVRLDHVAFGVVVGGDGKKFKTRSGETERLIDLLNAAIDKAYTILKERNETHDNPMTEDEIKHTAKALGINAIKYSDLSTNRIHDYVFSYDRMLRFEGNTAAYLMYSFVRIQGIKRKIKNAASAPIVLENPLELALGLHLGRFEEILDSITQDLMPNRLCDYLYELSDKFNAFFRDCRVEGVPEQNQRLALCELTERVFKEGMGILGLTTVDRM